MIKRIIFFLALVYTIVPGQLQKSKLLNGAFPEQNIFYYSSLEKKENIVQPLSLNEKEEANPSLKAIKPSVSNNSKLEFNPAKITPVESMLSITPIKLDNRDILSAFYNQPTKLEKFGLSQLIFAGMGIIDYSIKEAPMYPNHREDSFFWQSAWGGMIWGSSISLNLIFVKDTKYLLGLLTEDMTYYICRNIFHKQSFPGQFGLPMKVFGADQVSMNTMVIIWAASVTYLLLDSLDIL